MMSEAERAAARAMLAALKKARRGLDQLMPGIGGLAIPAEEIANIIMAFIESARAIAQAEAAGIEGS